ncbi:response regulator [Aeromicrobium camelliae]|uniref:response regulator n=1 Tax=Aeromicrobium camelliae TaxID=1538144 RepID=UPI001AA0A825|nr:response regulator transcription factor [Aeromicrobium camelliae]
MPSVLIVDDHAAVRAGVKAMLELDERIDVVGEAANGREGLELVGVLRPDVLMLDLQLPDLDGTEVCQQVTETTGTRVLILTAFGIDANVIAALDAGASGFLTKAADPQEMSVAIHAVAQGDAYLTPTVTRHVVERATSRGSAPSDRAGEPVADAGLTAREHEIWRLMGEGMTNKQIAEVLTISPATVKTHVSRVLQKLGVATRTHAAVLARDAGPR